MTTRPHATWLLPAVMAGALTLGACADNGNDCRDRVRPAGGSHALDPPASAASVLFLEARSADDTSVVLSWFAPIDYCFDEVATRFEFRYSDDYGTLAGWDGATVLPDTIPARHRTERAFVTIGGLSPGRTYFFAYRVFYVTPGNTQVSMIAQDRTTRCGAAFPASGFDFVRRFDPNPGATAHLVDIDSDPAGDVYVLNRAGNVVRKYSETGALLKQWGGTGGGPGQILLASRIAVGLDGFVYVSEATGRVQRFSRDGDFLGEVVPPVDQSLWFYFQRQDLAVDPSGIVYVANRDLGRVRKYDAEGRLLLTWGDDTPVVFSNKFEPSGLAVDADGGVFVSSGDVLRPELYRFTPNGELTDTWSTTAFCPGRLWQDVKLRATGDGTIFALDPRDARVYRLSTGGALLQVFGRLGSEDGRFRNPFSLGVSASGRVFVLDYREEASPGFDVVVFRREPAP